MNWLHRDERLLDQALQRVRENPPQDGKPIGFPDLPPSLSDLLRLAIDLDRTVAAAPPRSAFIAEAEKKLLQSLPTKPKASRVTEQTRPALFHRPGRVFTAAVLAILLAVFSGWGTLSASAAALPGDALYPVKIGSEQVQLALTISPEENVRLLIRFSGVRIGEIQDLIRLGRSNDLAQALADYEQTIRLIERGADRLPDNKHGMLPEFRQSLSLQRELLSELRGKLPAESQSKLDTALSETDHVGGVLQEMQSASKDHQSAILHGRGPQKQNPPHNNQPTKIKTPRETKNPNSQNTGPEKTPKPKK